MGNSETKNVWTALNEEITARKYKLVIAQADYDEIMQRSQSYIRLRGLFGVIGSAIWGLKEIGLGIVITLVLISFWSYTSGTGIPLPNWTINRTVTVTDIVSAAPQDAKRAIVKKVFNDVAGQIDNGVISETSDVFTNLKVNLAAVIANKDWKATIDGINTVLNAEKDAAGMSTKLKEIAGKL